MKKLKLFACICALMMGLSLTSCLDSGDTTTYDDIRTVYVNGSYRGVPYFTDAVGNIYRPSIASWTNIETQLADGVEISDFKMVAILFNYIVEEENAGADTKQSTTTPQVYDIELAAITTFFQAPNVMYVQSVEDLEAYEKAPVIPLGSNVSNYTYLAITPQQYDEKVVAATTGFFMGQDEDNLKEHQFNMIYVKDEITASSKDLTLYVCHNNGEDDETDAYWGAACCFDLERALAEIRSVTGNSPENFVIKAKTSNYASKDLPENYTDYTIEYKTLEELYPSAFENN